MARMTTAPATAAVRPLTGVRLLGLTGLVALGGAVGTLLRWLPERVWAPEPSAWPWTTFWINLCGSLVLGMLLEWVLRTGPDHGPRRAVRLGVGTGLVGGFTTYSTFVLEIIGLVQDGHAALGVAYALVSIVLGIVGAGAGIGLAAMSWRWVAQRRGEGS